MTNRCAEYQHCNVPNCLLIGPHNHTAERVLCSCCQGDMECAAHAKLRQRVAELETIESRQIEFAHELQLRDLKIAALEAQPVAKDAEIVRLGEVCAGHLKDRETAYVSLQSKDAALKIALETFDRIQIFIGGYRTGRDIDVLRAIAEVIDALAKMG